VYQKGQGKLDKKKSQETLLRNSSACLKKKMKLQTRRLFYHKIIPTLISINKLILRESLYRGSTMGWFTWWTVDQTPTVSFKAQELALSWLGY
jgi:hypothetical protein